MTGCTGFLGSDVFAKLIVSGIKLENIILLGRKKPQTEKSLLGLRLKENGLSAATLLDKIEFIELDFENEKSFQQGLESKLKPRLKPGFTMVHMAAMISTPKDANVEAQTRANVGVTEDLFNFCSQTQAGRFVFTSSVVAWGGEAKTEIRSEKDFINFNPLCWTLPYFSTKRTAHEKVLDLARKSGIPTHLLCPGIIHGTLDYQKTSRKFLKLLTEGRLPAIPPGGGNIVGLDRVTQSVLDSISKPLATADKPFVQLVVDENLSFREYFQKYLSAWGKVTGQKIPPMPRFIPPRTLSLGVGRMMGILGKLVGKHFSLGEALVPGSLFLYFRSDYPLPPTRGVAASLEDSVRSEKTNLNS